MDLWLLNIFVTFEVASEICWCKKLKEALEPLAEEEVPQRFGKAAWQGMSTTIVKQLPASEKRKNLNTYQNMWAHKEAQGRAQGAFDGDCNLGFGKPGQLSIV